MAAAILLLLIGYDIFQRKNFQKTEGQVVTVGWQGDLQTENQEEYIMVSYMADGVSYVEKHEKGTIEPGKTADFVTHFLQRRAKGHRLL